MATIKEQFTKALKDLAEAHDAYLEKKNVYDDLRKIVDKFSGKETTQSGSWIVEYIDTKTTSVDWNAIKEDYPDFDKSKYMKSTPTKKFNGVHKVSNKTLEV